MPSVLLALIITLTRGFYKTSTEFILSFDDFTFDVTVPISVIGTLRYGDYGLRTTVGRKVFLIWSTGPSTQRVARKYKLRSQTADTGLRTTREVNS